MAKKSKNKHEESRFESQKKRISTLLTQYEKENGIFAEHGGREAWIGDWKKVQKANAREFTLLRMQVMAPYEWEPLKTEKGEAFNLQGLLKTIENDIRFDAQKEHTQWKAADATAELEKISAYLVAKMPGLEVNQEKNALEIALEAKEKVGTFVSQLDSSAAASGKKPLPVRQNAGSAASEVEAPMVATPVPQQHEVVVEAPLPKNTVETQSIVPSTEQSPAAKFVAGKTMQQWMNSSVFPSHLKEITSLQPQKIGALVDNLSRFRQDGRGIKNMADMTRRWAADSAAVSGELTRILGDNEAAQTAQAAIEAVCEAIVEKNPQLKPKENTR